MAEKDANTAEPPAQLWQRSVVFGPATGRLKRRDQLYAAFIAGSPGVELREAAEALDCHAEASRGHTFAEAAVIFSLVDASGKRPAVHFLRAIRGPDPRPSATGNSVRADRLRRPERAGNRPNSKSIIRPSLPSTRKLFEPGSPFENARNGPGTASSE